MSAAPSPPRPPSLYERTETKMSRPRLAFVDTETTGLDPDRHDIWEVGMVLRDEEGNDMEYDWQLHVDLGSADAVALRIGRDHERRYEDHLLDSPDEFAKDFAALTRGCHLVGAVISFDEERLRRMLRANGACPEWHYHLVDVEALIAGKHAVAPPWNSDALAALVGVSISDEDRHTALGDARWARDLYDAVIGEGASIEDVST